MQSDNATEPQVAALPPLSAGVILSDHAWPAGVYPRPGSPSVLRAPSVSHSRSVLYGASVWARGVLSGRKRRFPARAAAGLAPGAEMTAEERADHGWHSSIETPSRERS